MAFVSSPSPYSTNEVPTVFGVSTATAQVSTANLSDATMYAFLANQPNGSQLVHEDLEQIHKNDLEEMDLNECGRHIFQSIDGASFDWSYMADDEAPKNMAFMALLDSKYDKLRVEFNKSKCNLADYKRGLASVEEQLVHYQTNESLLNENIVVLKRDIKIKESGIVVLKSKLEKISNEKDAFETKIKKFENASQSLDKLIGSQVTNNSNKGLGYVSYNVIPPPHTGRFSPPRIDLSHTSLPEFAKPSVRSYRVKPIEVVTHKSSVKIYAPVKENNGAPLIEDWESDEEDKVESPHEKERKTVEPSMDKVEVEIPKQNDKPAKRPVKYAEMLGANTIRGKGWPINPKRNFQRRAAYININFFKKVNTAKEKVNTARPNSAVLNAVRANKRKAEIYHISLNLRSLMECMLHLEEELKVVRLLEKERSEVMCDKKNSVIFTDTECFVLSHDFKLADESRVLLKVHRKNNMYSVDMKNIVPKKDLTCLVANVTNNESMLWHKRLGYINFKNINKLVKCWD
nr:ribonuclease H-like domain-containing protein [Tanacetum cinerariifolium]